MPLGPGTKPVAGYTPGETWTPSYDFAAGDRSLEVRPLDRSDDDNPAWVIAPGDSHLERFKFDRSQKTRTVGITPPTLWVRFKPTAKTGATEYKYTFPTDSAGLEVFDKMVGHPDPGEIVWSDLIRQGVPYDKVYG